MAGRAGRTGLSSKNKKVKDKGAQQVGKSYIILPKSTKSELEKAISIATSACAAVQSQLDPSILNSEGGAGTALLKLLIEVIGLNLCRSQKEIKSFFQGTLYSLDSKKMEGNNISGCVDGIVSSSIAFLHQSKIIDMDGEKITLSKFGSAMFLCNLDIDDSIELYERIIQVQNSGIILENVLHLLCLVVPWDDFRLKDRHENGNVGATSTISIDLEKFIELYERNSKTKSKIITRVANNLGIPSILLEKWRIRPPTQINFGNCFHRKTFRYFLFGRENPSLLVNKNTQSVSNDEWLAYCSVQRLYTSFILFRSMESGNIEFIKSVMKEFSMSSFTQLDSLKRKTQIYAKKLKKFCQEIGFKQFIPLCERLAENLEHSLNNLSETGESLELMSAFPKMTKHVAEILHKYNIRSVQSLSEKTSIEIFNLLQQESGFDPKQVYF